MANCRTCESCGQKVRKLNPHTMDGQKIRVLEDIAKLNLKGYEWVLVKEGEALETETDDFKVRTAYRARAHASRLVWFGLLDSKGYRSGAYKVNANGLAFLTGRLTVAKTIYCQGGVVVEAAKELVTVSSVKKASLDRPYWDNYAKLQKYPDGWNGQLTLEL